MTRAALKWTLILASLAACHPAPVPAGSTTQSLDNLVAKAQGNAEKDNFCGVAYTKLAALPEHVRVMNTNKRIKGPVAMKKVVLGTLAAAPLELLRPFAAADGVIEVKKTIAAAEKACAKAPLTTMEKSIATSTVQSCWLNNPTRIILPPVAKRIRSDLVRQLSYFFTEYFVERGNAGSDLAEAKAFFQGFKKTRSLLANAFMADIKTSNPDAYKKLTSSLSAEHRANYVYAEAVDSYYCSSSTAATSPRGIFQANYNTAYQVFTDKTNDSSPINVFGE